MIRVGGGWDTLEHYLDKHDPCRCNFGGKYSIPQTPFYYFRSQAKYSNHGNELKEKSQNRNEKCAYIFHDILSTVNRV